MGVSLHFSFASGFTEHAIHVRGSLASATVDFDRNTYVRHRHTPYGMDLDRYRMSVTEARALARQARGASKAKPFTDLMKGEMFDIMIDCFFQAANVHAN